MNIFSPPSNSSSQSSNSSNSSTSSSSSWVPIAVEVAKYALWAGFTIYIGIETINVLKSLESKNKPSARQVIESKRLLAKRLKRPEVETISFDDYETRLLPDVLGSDDIGVTFADIGGLESQLEEVVDNIVLPMQLFHHGRSMKALKGLTSCPTGVLLYGRPGTGKSLMAKAIAKETGCTFLNIKASSLTDKWFGESDHLVAALFSLGRKLGPSVIFIDEIETLLRKRGGEQINQALISMQGIFLSEWDGLSVANETSAPVIVVGASNRPMDLDPAFLRRMPVRIMTEMPSAEARFAILKAQLRNEEVDGNVDLQQIAVRIEGYTGSDIRELVRLAVLQRAKAITASCRSILLGTKANTSTNSATSNGEVLNMADSDLAIMRPLNVDDFELAIKKTQEIVEQAHDYNQEIVAEDYNERLNKFIQVIGNKIGGK